MKTPNPISEFLRQLKVEQGLSPNTISSYNSQLKQYLKFLKARKQTLQKASHNNIVSFLESKMKKGHKSATRFHAIIVIKRFHQFLAGNGFCKNDASTKISLPRIKSKLPNPLKIEEIKKILNRPFLSSYTQIRNQALLEILYATAMRASELINLKMEQIDMHQCWIRVLGKGDRERIVPFGKIAQLALKRYLQIRNKKFKDSLEFVFLNPRGLRLTRGGFWWILKQRAEEVGIKDNVFPHRIRHTTITHLLSKGADIRSLQALAGHQSILTTQRYAHVTPDYLKKTFKNFHPRA